MTELHSDRLPDTVGPYLHLGLLAELIPATVRPDREHHRL